MGHEDQAFEKRVNVVSSDDRDKQSSALRLSSILTRTAFTELQYMPATAETSRYNFHPS